MPGTITISRIPFSQSAKLDRNQPNWTSLHKIKAIGQQPGQDFVDTYFSSNSLLWLWLWMWLSQHRNSSPFKKKTDAQVFKPSFETPRTPPRPLSSAQTSPTKEQRQIKTSQELQMLSSVTFYCHCLRFSIVWNVFMFTNIVRIVKCVNKKILKIYQTKFWLMTF